MSILAYSLQSMLVGVFSMIGLQQIFGSKMQVEDFKRLGLSQRFRTISGWVQLIGVIGLIIGYWIPAFAIISGFWIGLTMIVACYTHGRVSQQLSMALPAFGMVTIAFTLSIIHLYTL